MAEINEEIKETNISRLSLNKKRSSSLRNFRSPDSIVKAKDGPSNLEEIMEKEKEEIETTLQQLMKSQIVNDADLENTFGAAGDIDDLNKSVKVSK